MADDDEDRLSSESSPSPLNPRRAISSYQTQTVPCYFYNKTRVRGLESSYRTIIKNLELFLKTRIF